MLKIIFMLFVIGHVLGDFYLQSNQLALKKNKSSAKLVEHGVLYFVSMFLMLIPIFGFGFLKWVVLVALIHFFIDAGMAYLYKRSSFTEKQQAILYVVDQVAHLVTLLIITGVIASRIESIQYTEFVYRLLVRYPIAIDPILSWILAIAVTIKPVSITINKVLYQYQPTTADAEDAGHPGAGALIGILERLIILVMLSQNQYGAIGFVLTAKSIARYNKITENPQFSEYFLLGTLLSMLLVIVTYLAIFS